MADEERRGDWFVTFTGRRFYPFDARVDDIDIKDIAHSLSLQTRWNGHCTTFYSVASHSLACARVAERTPFTSDIVTWALMHDAAEAYIGDIIRPIKRCLCRPVFEDEVDPLVGLYLEDPDENGYARIDGFVQSIGAGVEKTLLRLIAEKFTLPWPVPREVFAIDDRMLVTEAMHITNYGKADHWVTEKPWVHIKPYAGDHVLLYQDSKSAENAFLALAREYLELPY